MKIMSWIETIHESVAEGELANVYDSIAESRGKVSNIMRIQSLNPAAMRAHMDLYLSVMYKRSGVSRADRELIAAVVSVANHCPYCTNHHEEALRAYWKDDDRVRRVVHEKKWEYLTERQRAMLAYAIVLTERPGDASESDVQGLRDIGLSDRDILDVNLVTSYFNFVNRIAQGLGVDFSPEEMKGYNY